MPSYHHICALVNSNTTPDWSTELRATSRDAPTSNLNRDILVQTERLRGVDFSAAYESNRIVQQFRAPFQGIIPLLKVAIGPTKLIAHLALYILTRTATTHFYFLVYVAKILSFSISANLPWITYAYIAPVIIACGILGDVLTVVTLTHPLLRKSTIVYTYLTLLAMTDLLTQFSAIPMIMWLLDIRACSAAASFFYAHIGFPLANALMGSSVWIVVFLTLSQYMAVCRPFAYGLRSRKVCFILFSLAYIFNFCIYAPWAVKKEVHNLKKIVGEEHLPENVCPYIVCDTRRADWFMIYEAVRELISRIFPFFLVAYMNAKILITYRNTKKDRMLRLTSSQKQFVFERSEKEEKRLFVLLFTIIIIFFLCTIPAAPLTILVADNKSNNVPFQVFRAIVNLLEFTKFALNFYFYCLINPDIRRICMYVIMCKKITRPPRVKGQSTTPISFYTRSTKNSMPHARTGSGKSYSSDDHQYPSRQNSERKNAPMDTTVAMLDVIKESDNLSNADSEDI